MTRQINHLNVSLQCAAGIFAGRIFTVAVASRNRVAEGKSCELSAAVNGCKKCLGIEFNAFIACTTTPFLYFRGHRSGEMLWSHRYELILLRFGRYSTQDRNLPSG